VEECKERDVTYAAPLNVKVRLVNRETGEIKEQNKEFSNISKIELIGNIDGSIITEINKIIYKISHTYYLLFLIRNQ